MLNLRPRFTSPQWWLIACSVFCLLLTIVLYWQGLNGVFLLDDYQNIVVPYLPEMNWVNLWYQLTHNDSGMLGRSLSVLSFTLTGLQFGIHPWGYKLHNLIVHMLCSVLLFRFLYLLLPVLTRQIATNTTLLIAGLVAAIWLLHPLQVSTVLYVVQRMTQLSVFFTLLTLIIYLEFRLQYGQGWRYWLYGWFWFPLSLLLALLSKEIGALIPVYILAIELLAFRTGLSIWRQHRQYAKWLLVFVVLPLVAGALICILYFDRIADYTGRTFTLSERLMSQLHVVPYYMRLILLPRLTAMNLFQDDVQVTHSMDVLTTVFALGLALLGIAIVVLRKKAPVVAFGLAWFFVAHLMESTFIPLELVFEHRNYLALAGLWLAVIHTAFTVAELKPARWLVAAFLLMCAGMTFVRAREWSDEGLLLSQGALDHPNSPRVRTTYANYLFRNNRVVEGIEQLIATAALEPDNAGALIHRLHAMCLSEARDDDAYAEAIRRLSLYTPSIYALNTLEALINSVDDGVCKKLTREDMHNLVDTALNRPGAEENLLNYGYLHRFKGILYLNDRRYAEGVIALRQAHEYAEQDDLLAELVALQVKIGMLSDAEDTLADLKKINEEKGGIETYQVNRVSALIEKARTEAANSSEQVQQSDVTAVEVPETEVLETNTTETEVVETP
jgi:protein O-mannosyl-transferase